MSVVLYRSCCLPVGKLITSHAKRRPVRHVVRAIEDKQNEQQTEPGQTLRDDFAPSSTSILNQDRIPYDTISGISTLGFLGTGLYSFHGISSTRWRPRTKRVDIRIQLYIQKQSFTSSSSKIFQYYVCRRVDSSCICYISSSPTLVDEYLHLAAFTCCRDIKRPEPSNRPTSSTSKTHRTLHIRYEDCILLQYFAKCEYSSDSGIRTLLTFSHIYTFPRHLPIIPLRQHSRHTEIYIFDTVDFSSLPY